MTPATYRQLSRAQILTRFTGQKRARCVVQALRLCDPQPVVVAAGEHTLHFQWSSAAARHHSAASSPQLAILTLDDVEWAEYGAGDMGADGRLLSEDYVLRLFAPDGEGHTLVAYEAAE